MRCPTVSNWKSSCCICISTGVGGSRYSLTLASSVCEQNLPKTRQKNQHVATKYRSKRERQEFLSINPAAFEMCFTTALWWLSWRSTAPPDTWKKVASQFHLLVERVVADFFFFSNQNIASVDTSGHLWSEVKGQSAYVSPGLWPSPLCSVQLLPWELMSFRLKLPQTPHREHYRAVLEFKRTQFISSSPQCCSQDRVNRDQSHDQDQSESRLSKGWDQVWVQFFV